MWISRKEYKFLKENAEKNIDIECQILTAKENQKRAVARAMEEYSAVLQERDELKFRVIELEHQLELKNNAKHGHWFLLDECANAGVYCSTCHKKVYTEHYANVKEKSRFCPNCGAMMDEKNTNVKE